MGDRLHGLLSDLLEKMIEAHYSPKEEKGEKLRELNILLTKLRYFFRLGHEMGCYSAGHLKLLSEKVNEIGRRVGGWIKAIS
ncbi:MAG: four helix bundle protein [Bacteroidota bacterium]